jgi:ATP-dependent Clp protease ATP-binding subunit ClpA
LESAQRVLADLHPPGAERGSRQVPISAQAREALEQALLEALRLGHAHLGGEHILLGIVRSDSTAAGEVLDGLGVEPDDVERCLGKVLLDASFDAR